MSKFAENIIQTINRLAEQTGTFVHETGKNQIVICVNPFNPDSCINPALAKFQIAAFFFDFSSSVCCSLEEPVLFGSSIFTASKKAILIGNSITEQQQNEIVQFLNDSIKKYRDLQKQIRTNLIDGI